MDETTVESVTNVDDRSEGTVATSNAADDSTAHLEDELLVEEISIDGMCGVY